MSRRAAADRERELPIEVSVPTKELRGHLTIGARRGRGRGHHRRRTWRQHAVALPESIRLGAPLGTILGLKGNLATAYQKLGRLEPALQMKRDVYSGTLKLFGEESSDTIREASNIGGLLNSLQRCEEVKTLMRKTMPVAQRVLGESNSLTLRMKMHYARALYRDSAATLDDLREAVKTLEETERTARRVLGNAHPLVDVLEWDLRKSRAALDARETPPPGGA